MRVPMREWLVPQWPAPPSVRSLSTLRVGGESKAPFDSWNLADHVGDNSGDVAHNRRLLCEALKLPHEPLWLRQTHGVQVAHAGETGADPTPEADACIATSPGWPCVVLTADCLPVLLCTQDGAEVAAAHAGWRGLAAGVLEATVQAFTAAPDRLMAWLGPAIGPDAFEVGAEVRTRFLDQDPGADSAFRIHGHRYLADLYSLARRRLHLAGVDAVYGGGLCTLTDRARFFSYRRDGNCGRMATLVWIEG